MSPGLDGRGEAVVGARLMPLDFPDRRYVRTLIPRVRPAAQSAQPGPCLRESMPSGAWGRRRGVPDETSLRLSCCWKWC